MKTQFFFGLALSTVMLGSSMFALYFHEPHIQQHIQLTTP